MDSLWGKTVGPAYADGEGHPALLLAARRGRDAMRDAGRADAWFVSIFIVLYVVASLEPTPQMTPADAVFYGVAYAHLLLLAPIITAHATASLCGAVRSHGGLADLRALPDAPSPLYLYYTRATLGGAREQREADLVGLALLYMAGPFAGDIAGLISCKVWPKDMSTMMVNAFAGPFILVLALFLSATANRLATTLAAGFASGLGAWTGYALKDYLTPRERALVADQSGLEEPWERDEATGVGSSLSPIALTLLGMLARGAMILLFVFAIGAIVSSTVALTVGGNKPPLSPGQHLWWHPGPEMLLIGFAALACVGIVRGNYLARRSRALGLDRPLE